MTTAPRRMYAFPRPEPLTLAFGQSQTPLPVRLVSHPGRRVSPLVASPWSAGAPAFDFCAHIERLAADIVRRCPELRHIDLSRVLVCATQARSGRRHGLQARVTPLRFVGGQLVRRRRGVSYQVQRYFVNGREMLYLMTFCLPRFLDQPFEDKLVTVFHELYHIGPAFDGDLRRHGGRCHLHTRSKHGYDAHMDFLARQYLRQGPDQRLHDFLRLNFAQLQARHGGVRAVVVPRPKVVPIPAPANVS